MKMSAFGLLSLLLLANGVPALAVNMEITENQLIGYARESNQTLTSAEMARQQAALAKSKFDESYETTLSSAISRSNSKQAALSPFAPVMGPVDHFDVNIGKYLGGGVQVSAGLFADQLSTKDRQVDRSSETGVRADIKIDLWKNIFGQLDKQRAANTDFGLEVANIKTQIDQKGFEYQVRKAYWSLVANNESMVIAEDLVRQARKQLKESQRRLRSGVADKAEVNRFLALQSNREAQLTAVKYQRQQVNMMLKSMLPGLKGKNLQTSQYDIGNTIRDVLVCTVVIKNENAVPWKYTKLDELLKIYGDRRQSKNDLADATSSADINLVGQYELSGSGYKYSNSTENFQDDPKPAYSIGLMISKPIGGQKSASERIEKILATTEYETQKFQLQSKVHARHEEMLPMIDLLQATVTSQNENAKYLQIVREETQKQYNQARVNVDSLIQIENDLLSSKIQLIQAELAVIHEILDYFTVFTETPCPMNRI